MPENWEHESSDKDFLSLKVNAGTVSVRTEAASAKSFEDGAWLFSRFPERMPGPIDTQSYGQSLIPAPASFLPSPCSSGRTGDTSGRSTGLSLFQNGAI